MLLKKKIGEQSDYARLSGLFLLTLAAVFSKEQAASLPFLAFFILLMQHAAENAEPKAGIFSRLKFFLKNSWKDLASIALPVLFYILLRISVIGSLSQVSGWGGGKDVMAFTMLRAFVRYIQLSIWPHPLSVNYDTFGISL